MPKNSKKTKFTDSNKGLVSGASVHSHPKVPTGVITAGTPVIFEPTEYPRALRIHAEGTLYYSDVNDIEVALPVAKYDTIPFNGCSKIGALTDVDVTPWW